MMKFRATYYLQDVLDLRSFLVIELAEDGTVVPKHVEVGT
jgi:hypothetical protein